MIPAPKTTKELQALGYFGDDIAKIIKWLKKYWTGLKALKPKGYKEYLKDYTDYKDMGSQMIQDAIDDYEGWDDGTVTDFSLPEKLTLPHIAYDDTNQGRDPLTMFISAMVQHGFAIGKLYGSEERAKGIENRLGHAILCRMIPEFEGKVSKRTMKALHELHNKIFYYMREMLDGKHNYDCDCKYCKINFQPLTDKQKAEVKKKVLKAIKKRK